LRRFGLFVDSVSESSEPSSQEDTSDDESSLVTSISCVNLLLHPEQEVVGELRLELELDLSCVNHRPRHSANEFDRAFLSLQSTWSKYNKFVVDAGVKV
tara:strand:+ start:439 stop:735 length:297 start_codon:yes stop_codon:yes gene_type:complete